MARKKAPRRKPVKQKPCQLCQQGIQYVDYKNLPLIHPFLNERGRIKARRTTGNCPQHQTKLAEAVKNAREMALLPYVNR